MLDNESEIAVAEATEWFFDDRLPIWVGVGNGSIRREAEFILHYWGVVLSGDHPDGASWRLDGDAVTGLLNTMQTPLKAHGFTHTEVIDRSVRAHHRNGAAIEAIWSCRRAADTEVEPLVVHFEEIRAQNGWRVAGIRRPPTHADTLSNAWAAIDARGNR
jgi:hypothetical protein